MALKKEEVLELLKNAGWKVEHSVSDEKTTIQIIQETINNHQECQNPKIQNPKTI